MTLHHAFTFHGQTLWALPQAALWLPDAQTLCVSDLHLGKSDRIARRSGRMLPPYEVRATLEILAALIDQYLPKTVICLGDSFDDIDAAESLSRIERDDVLRMQAGRDWIWIEGNHDPGPVDFGGRHLKEHQIDSITFRHIAEIGKTGEVSGHFHPKCRLSHGASRPSFLIDQDKVIMPAFGTYTGGLRASDPALRNLMQDDAIAVLTGRKAMPVPLNATS
jgi:DNA ligase-associated metallophosphoesterase